MRYSNQAIPLRQTIAPIELQCLDISLYWPECHFANGLILFTANLVMEKAYQFSRFDCASPLSTCSEHPIFLDDQNWLTCEHYVQAKTLRNAKQAMKVGSLPSGEKAHGYGKAWYRSKIADYKSTAPILMKRALYIKVQMYEEVREALLATEDRLIVETSQYDYFWGIGRDQRGLNHIGKAWMDIRDKLCGQGN